MVLMLSSTTALKTFIAGPRERAVREGLQPPGLLVFWARGGGGGGGGGGSWFVSASESTPLGTGVDSPPRRKERGAGACGVHRPARRRGEEEQVQLELVPFKVILPTTGSDGLFCVE
ncbi:unnamed protein product [Boreogadus saida]